VVSGPHRPGNALTDPMINPFGGDSVPVRVTGTAKVLPVVGADGILVDLAAAQQVLAGAGNGGTFEVWLAKGAPDSIVDRLRAAGLAVIADRDQAGRRQELATRGPALANRYELFTALVGLLLAAAALTVSASVERDTRAVELGALRVQGLSGRVAAVVGYAGYAALIVLGVVAGVVATIAANAVASRPAPPFNDGWAVLRPPGALQPLALLVTGVVALAALGVLWWLAAAPLARQLRGEPR
jgi:putative ABC transport system permease protein